MYKNCFYYCFSITTEYKV